METDVILAGELKNPGCTRGDAPGRPSKRARAELATTARARRESAFTFQRDPTRLRLRSSKSDDARLREGNAAQAMDSMNRSFPPGSEVGKEG